MKTINQTTAKVSLGKRQSEDTTIFHPIHYQSTGKGNWYEQDLEYFERPTFKTETLPYQVQIEYCYKAKIHADFLLTFQDDAGYLKALTGIRKTIVPDWYYGDLRSFLDGQTITSLVLIQFSPDRSLFRLYMFESYYPKGGKRIHAINKIIQQILSTGRPTKQVLHAINTIQSGISNQETEIQSFNQTN